MKRHYECLYIIANNINEEKRGELMTKFSKMTGDSHAKLEKWGLKKFATPIDYKKDGYYVLMNFTALPDVPKQIGDLMNITDGIVRYMFVCKDDVKIKKGVKAKPEGRPEKKSESKSEENK